MHLSPTSGQYFSHSAILLSMPIKYLTLDSLNLLSYTVFKFFSSPQNTQFSSLMTERQSWQSKWAEFLWIDNSFGGLLPSGQTITIRKYGAQFCPSPPLINCVDHFSLAVATVHSKQS